MKTTMRFDYACVPAGEKATIRLMLSVGGDGKKVRPMPLNLAVVLDRSGSMQGDKIRKVLETTKMVAGMMQQQDVFSLVTFNNTVQTLIPNAKGPDLKGIEKLLSQVTADANTFLSGGYEEGVRLASVTSHGMVSRVLLLSDGQANEGITDHSTLADMAKKNLSAHITTSTFGVGSDFDEELMKSMAESGGGNSFYIEEPEHSEAVFREELEYMRGLLATDCTVTFKCAAGVCATLLNNYAATGNNSWLIGDISTVEERSLVLEIEVPISPVAGTELQVGEFEVNWSSMADDGRFDSTRLQAGVRVVTTGEFGETEPDRIVVIEAAMQAAASAKREARVLALQRRFDEAADVLDRFAIALEGLGLNDPCLNDEIKDLRERAARIRTERDRFYNPKMNKLMAYETEMMSKGRKSSYMSMKQRAVNMHSEQTGNMDAIMVSFEPLTGQSERAVALPVTGITVSELLKRIYEQMPDDIPPNSYGRRWVLRDRRTGRVFDIGSSWARANARKIDERATLTAGIREGMELEVVGLPALTAKVSRHQVAPGSIRIDLESILGATAGMVTEPFVNSMPACDFLARVFSTLSSVVRPNTYGTSWLLRDAATGRVFDTGSAWASAMGTLADIRPLSSIGLRGGSVIQAVMVRH
jgi:Ca-activated chloride channel homolog